MARGLEEEEDRFSAVMRTVWNSRGFVTVAVGSCLPEVSGVGGGNISLGLPESRLLSRSFLAMPVAAGLACAILDRLDAEIRKTIVTSDLLMGRDEYAMRVLARSGSGRSPPVKLTYINRGSRAFGIDKDTLFVPL